MRNPPPPPNVAVLRTLRPPTTPVVFPAYAAGGGGQRKPSKTGTQKMNTKIKSGMAGLEFYVKNPKHFFL